MIQYLIAKHFIHNPNNYNETNHKNGIKTDNRIENLEWCTHKYNNQHAYKTGLNPTGERHHNATLTNKQVKQIREMYKLEGKYTQRKLAKIFNTSQSVISYIINKHWWNYI